MAETYRLTYTGNPALASALVQMLEEEGIAVEWERPGETRDAHVADIVVGMIAAGLYDTTKTGILAAVRRFRARFPGGGSVESDDLDLDDDN